MAEAGGLLIANTYNNDGRKIISVEYPGFVSDVETAIGNLGGIKGIAKAHMEGRKLEMKFRPNDHHCKPVLSKVLWESTIILKIKKKKCRLMDTECSIEELDCNYAVDVIGIVSKSFRFNGLADYQVLSPGLSSIKYKHLNDFQIKDPLENDYCMRDIPTFLPPSYFSKFDKPLNFIYRSTGSLMDEATSGISHVKHRPRRLAAQEFPAE